MNALIINCSPVRNGATAEIVRLVSKSLCTRFETKAVCIDDYHFAFCKGCRSCHKTAECMQHDDVEVLMASWVGGYHRFGFTFVLGRYSRPV